MEKEVYGGNKEVGNIKEKLCFSIFKTSRKKRQKEIQENSGILTTNDSTNMLTS